MVRNRNPFAKAARCVVRAARNLMFAMGNLLLVAASLIEQGTLCIFECTQFVADEIPQVERQRGADALVLYPQ